MPTPGQQTGWRVAGFWADSGRGFTGQRPDDCPGSFALSLLSACRAIQPLALSPEGWPRTGMGGCPESRSEGHLGGAAQARAHSGSRLCLFSEHVVAPHGCSHGGGGVQQPGGPRRIPGAEAVVPHSIFQVLLFQRVQAIIQLSHLSLNDCRLSPKPQESPSVSCAMSQQHQEMNAREWTSTANGGGEGTDPKSRRPQRQ